MTNYERIKSLTIEEMAQEIKLIANWDRKQKRKAERDEHWYEKYLAEDCEENRGSHYGRYEELALEPVVEAVVVAVEEAAEELYTENG